MKDCMADYKQVKRMNQKEVLGRINVWTEHNAEVSAVFIIFKRLVI